MARDEEEEGRHGVDLAEVFEGGRKPRVERCVGRRGCGSVAELEEGVHMEVEPGVDQGDVEVAIPVVGEVLSGKALQIV